jgi:stage V sporulation protein G
MQRKQPIEVIMPVTAVCTAKQHPRNGRKESEKMSYTKLDVRVFPIDEPKSGTLAFASIGVDNLLAIRGVRIMDGANKLYVIMPQSKDKENNYHDIAFPLSAILRKDIINTVLREYEYIKSLPPEQRVYEAPDINAANGIKLQDVNLDVRVYPIENPTGNTVAFASVGVKDLAAIRGIRVVDGANGLFVAMPQSKDKNGEYHDIAFPLNGDLRKEISKAVLDGYNAIGKDIDRKPKLGDRLAEYSQKAADHIPAQRVAAKSRNAGVLE